MIAYYRIPGIIASMALTLYTTLVLFIFSENGVALTLPGIAAFLLTVGMAVDANVLIFERIREELKKGLSVKTAVDKGFHNALSSIVDSNITTIIAGLVFLLYGNWYCKRVCSNINDWYSGKYVYSISCNKDINEIRS